MEAGQRWAYRARKTEPLVAVEVVKVGTNRPPRVFVQFVDDAFEGRQEWVPAARLKVAWADRDTYIESERQWAAIEALRPPRESHELGAFEMVAQELLPDEVATSPYNSTGVLVVRDLARLAQLSGIAESELTAHPAAFREDDAWVLPWPTAFDVAKRLAALDPEPVLAYVQTEENEARQDAIHGRNYGSARRGNEYVVSAETCAQVDRQQFAPIRALLRQWCGGDAADRWDELTELRKEVARLGSLVERAARTLDSHGLTGPARTLRDDLGTTVEQARSSRGGQSGG